MDLRLGYGWDKQIADGKLHTTMQAWNRRRRIRLTIQSESYGPPKEMEQKTSIEVEVDDDALAFIKITRKSLSPKTSVNSWKSIMEHCSG